MGKESDHFRSNWEKLSFLSLIIKEIKLSFVAKISDFIIKKVVNPNPTSISYVQI